MLKPWILIIILISHVGDVWWVDMLNVYIQTVHLAKTWLQDVALSTNIKNVFKTLTTPLGPVILYQEMLLFKIFISNAMNIILQLALTMFFLALRIKWPRLKKISLFHMEKVACLSFLASVGSLILHWIAQNLMLGSLLRQNYIMTISLLTLITEVILVMFNQGRKIFLFKTVRVSKQCMLL